MKTSRQNPLSPTALVAVATLAALAAGCSKDSDQQASQPTPSVAAAKKPVAGAANTKPAAGPGEQEDGRMANAVTVAGKTSAAVDLKYDMAAKPAVGAPFEVELAFTPRLPADSLEVQLTGMAGLTIASAPTLHFDKVVAGQAYTGKVLVSAGQSGLYYIGVVAKMVTQVQTDARTFSVPIVVGTLPAPAQKPAPEKDATGRPIESMPATEPSGS